MEQDAVERDLQSDNYRETIALWLISESISS